MKKKGLKKRNSSKSSQIRANTVDKGKDLRKKGGSSRKEDEIKAMQNSQNMEVDICDVCGHSGFINALMHCSVCSDIAVHQYCLGIPPGTIDDTFDWICEYCSPSMESEHYNSPAKESVREPVLAFEMETEQYENETILAEEELEPLCILPPLSHQEEHQTENAVGVPNIASTRGIYLLNFREEHDPTGSSCICRSLSCCDGSHLQLAEGISESSSLDHPFNDKEESEASVSSFMESPKEIMSGLVLLVKPSGDIIIYRDIRFCACLAMPTVNLTNNCNEMNSVKQVKKLNPFQMKPHMSSKLDEPIGNFRKAAYDCVDEETVEFGGRSLGTDKEIDAGQLHEDSGFSHAAVVASPEKESEDADGREDTIISHPGSHQIKCKRTAALVKFDLIPSLGPKCKRARSKKSILVPSLDKEDGACEVTGVQSIGEVALTAAGGLRELPGGRVENAALVGVHHGGIVYEFVPWNGAVEFDIAPWGSWKIFADNGSYKVELEATSEDRGTPLRDPTPENGLTVACKDTCFS